MKRIWPWVVLGMASLSSAMAVNVTLPLDPGVAAPVLPEEPVESADITAEEALARYMAREAAGEAVAAPVQSTPPQPQPGAVPEGTPVVPDEQAGGIQTNYTGLEMQRVGEFDARQGRPLNMGHADDLNYMQGYMRGQQNRLQQPGLQQGLQPMQQPAPGLFGR